MSARSQQIIAYRTLRRTAFAYPRLQLDGDQYPAIQNQYIGHAGLDAPLLAYRSA
jgi:hypothetical protein